MQRLGGRNHLRAANAERELPRRQGKWRLLPANARNRADAQRVLALGETLVAKALSPEGDPE
jgi:hypothetical protein